MNAKPIDVLIQYPLSDTQIQQLAAISPKVRISVPEGDKIPADLLEKAEILLTANFTPDPEKAPQLKWIQFAYAGLDFIVSHPLLDRKGFLATSLKGAAAPKVAEYALMAMLALAHRMPMMGMYQREKIWPADKWTRFQPHELSGSTVGLLGYGSIARELARLLQPFGVEIIATKKDLTNIHQKGYVPEGTGDPEGLLFTRLYPAPAIHSVLKASDFVVLSLPLTKETRTIIGAKEFEIMKPSAFLVSLGRGGQVEEDALIAALKEKKIAGAVLDVFSTEPLPKESPLWDAPNLVITPHIAGSTKNYEQLVFELFYENLQRYLSGEKLLNIYDTKKGY